MDALDSRSGYAEPMSRRDKNFALEHKVLLLRNVRKSEEKSQDLGKKRMVSDVMSIQWVSTLRKVDCFY